LIIIVCYNVVCFGVLWLSKAWFHRSIDKNPGIKIHEPSIIDSILGYGLLIGSIFQVLNKIEQGTIWHMLAPCHLESALLLYSYFFRTRNYKFASIVFHIGVCYAHFTFLALTMPDTSDHFHIRHDITFWCHHFILLFAPFVWLYNGLFQVHVYSAKVPFWSSFIFLLFCMDVELVFGLYSRVNINYMCSPPHHLPFLHTAFYRELVLGSVSTGCFLMGYSSPIIMYYIRSLFNVDNTSSSSSNTTKKSKKAH